MWSFSPVGGGLLAISSYNVMVVSTSFPLYFRMSMFPGRRRSWSTQRTPLCCQSRTLHWRWHTSCHTCGSGTLWQCRGGQISGSTKASQRGPNTLLWIIAILTTIFGWVVLLIAIFSRESGVPVHVFDFSWVIVGFLGSEHCDYYQHHDLCW